MVLLNAWTVGSLVQASMAEGTTIVWFKDQSFWLAQLGDRVFKSIYGSSILRCLVLDHSHRNVMTSCGAVL